MTQPAELVRIYVPTRSALKQEDRPYLVVPFDLATAARVLSFLSTGNINDFNKAAFNIHVVAVVYFDEVRREEESC